MNPISPLPAYVERIHTHLDDLARDLMPEHSRRVDAVMSVPVDLQVCAAERAGAHSKHDLAGSGLRLGDVFDPNVTGRVIPHDFHR